MSKKVFWPATLVVMGLIFLASNLGMLPYEFWNLWPLILIIVGLGGLLLSDRDEWSAPTPRTKSTPTKAKASKAKKTSKSRRK